MLLLCRSMIYVERMLTSRLFCKKLLTTLRETTKISQNLRLLCGFVYTIVIYFFEKLSCRVYLRQTNKAAHVLLQITTSRVSSHVFILLCITDLIHNDIPILQLHTTMIKNYFIFWWWSRFDLRTLHIYASIQQFHIISKTKKRYSNSSPQKKQL